MSSPHEYAFPDQDSYGLTKRELFAGMAMQGLITADPDAPQGVSQEAAERALAAASVGFADALLAELAKVEATSHE